MERSGLLARDRDEPWVGTWLDQAVEWGALARVRAVLSHGRRLDVRPDYRVHETLTHLLRGALFDPDSVPDLASKGGTGDRGGVAIDALPRLHALEQRKLAIWRALRNAGLPAPTLSDLDPEALHSGRGNGALWRALAQEAGVWTPPLAQAFLTLQLRGWHPNAAQGLTPVAWAMAHGAPAAVWSMVAVIAALRSSDATVKRGPTVDALLGELVRAGVRWAQPDRTPEGVVAQAVRYGASIEGLDHLVALRADFLWRGSADESVLMRALTTGAQASMVEALLDRAVRRHGPVGGRLLRRTDQNGATALHWAARAQDLASVRLLLDRGLLATDLDRHGRTTVHWAVRQAAAARRRPSRLVQVVETLVAHGANPLTVHARGRSALDELVLRGPPESLLPLLRPYVDRLHAQGLDGSWAQRLRERGRSVAAALETLELHHSADGVMLEHAPSSPRTVQRL